MPVHACVALQALQRPALQVRLHANHYPFSMPVLVDLQRCMARACKPPEPLLPHLANPTATPDPNPNAASPDGHAAERGEAAELLGAVLQSVQMQPAAAVQLQAPSPAAAAASAAATPSARAQQAAARQARPSAGAPALPPRPGGGVSSSVLAAVAGVAGRAAAFSRHSRTPSQLTEGSEGDMGCGVCFDNPNNLTIRDCGHKLCGAFLPPVLLPPQRGSGWKWKSAQSRRAERWLVVGVAWFGCAVSCYRQLVRPDAGSKAAAKCPFCRGTIQVRVGGAGAGGLQGGAHAQEGRLTRAPSRNVRVCAGL